MVVSKMGMDITLGCPQGYEPNLEVVSQAKREGCKNGQQSEGDERSKEAVKGADIVYTDVWASMGKEMSIKLRSKIFKPFQVNAHLVKEAKVDYLFMHCLPPIVEKR